MSMSAAVLYLQAASSFMEADMQSFLFLAAVLAFTVYGQLMMKARALVHATTAGNSPDRMHYLLAMFGDIGVLSGFVAAGLAAVCWMLAIERLEVGYAYPFMALSFLFVPLGSAVLFGESVPPLQWLGLAFIIAGVTISALAK
jgi:drug/metabolite transporter (DMT)-like permease